VKEAQRRCQVLKGRHGHRGVAPRLILRPPGLSAQQARHTPRRAG
jgi:hypothetical protein